MKNKQKQSNQVGNGYTQVQDGSYSDEGYDDSQYYENSQSYYPDNSGYEDGFYDNESEDFQHNGSPPTRVSGRDNLKRITNKESTRSRVKRQVSRGKRKREHFLWVKMWVSYLISMTMKDRGKIPDNIGDKILITNNLYITKQYMSTIVHVVELGGNTPETMIGVINSKLREKGNSCIIDVTLKNRKYSYDPKNSGLQSRIIGWERTLESSITRPSIKERAARCLYTVEQADKGVVLKHTRMFMTIRAKNVSALNQGEKIIYECLNAMGATYLPAYGTIKENLELISLLGNHSGNLKEVAPVMTSNQVISQIVPNCGSYNDEDGYYIGQDVLHGYPYFWNPKYITVARNIYICAPSGVGKTFLALNIMQSAFENGSAVCTMDIKGNEHTAFMEAIGGYVISLRPTSNEYINSWVMHAEDTDENNAEAYFKSRVNFSKQQMIILSGITKKDELVDFEELLDEFHDTLYVSMGVIPSNRNSWKSSENLNPYVVYEAFEDYLTPQKKAQYNLKKSLMGTLRMYMSESGSKSYIFKREFEYSDIINSPGISFDFGILSNQGVNDIDIDLFRLKFLYMSELNGQYVTSNYAKGKRTLKCLEESQIVTDEVLTMYAQEYTLRRSQMQDTLLLGNSVQALKNNKISQAIIENTRGLFIGELTLDAREVLMDQFGLRHLEGYIKIPGSKPMYSNSFAFINNMQKKQLYPIIKVVVPKEYGHTMPKYKVTIPTGEKVAMAGSNE